MIYVEMNVVSIFREQKAKGHVARLSNNGQNPHQISILVANWNFLTIYSRTVGLAQKAKKIYLFLSTYFFYHVNHQKSISSFIITSLKRIFLLHANHREKVKESKWLSIYISTFGKNIKQMFPRVEILSLKSFRAVRNFLLLAVSRDQ